MSVNVDITLDSLLLDYDLLVVGLIIPPTTSDSLHHFNVVCHTVSCFNEKLYVHSHSKLCRLVGEITTLFVYCMSNGCQCVKGFIINRVFLIQKGTAQICFLELSNMTCTNVSYEPHQLCDLG